MPWERTGKLSRFCKLFQIGGQIVYLTGGVPAKAKVSDGTTGIPHREVMLLVWADFNDLLLLATGEVDGIGGIAVGELVGVDGGVYVREGGHGVTPMLILFL